jgi:hypothetical protein
MLRLPGRKLSPSIQAVWESNGGGNETAPGCHGYRGVKLSPSRVLSLSVFEHLVNLYILFIYFVIYLLFYRVICQVFDYHRRAVHQSVRGSVHSGGARLRTGRQARQFRVLHQRAHQDVPGQRGAAGDTAGSSPNRDSPMSRSPPTASRTTTSNSRPASSSSRRSTWSSISEPPLSISQCEPPSSSSSLYEPLTRSLHEPLSVSVHKVLSFNQIE